MVQEYAYVYNGSSLMQMVVQTTVDDGTPTTDTLYFSYDASGIPMSLIYNGADYYYTVSLQGDVLSIRRLHHRCMNSVFYAKRNGGDSDGKTVKSGNIGADK